MSTSIKTGSSKDPRLAELDGLRGVAILMVLIYHAATHISTAPGSWQAYLMATTRLWWTGVDLFFVISGFLITHILINHREAKNYYQVFYLRRVLRIFPLYYLLLVVVLVANQAYFRFSGQDQYNDGRIAAWNYFIFVQNWPIGALGHGGITYLAITWSLAIEEQFYLVIPLACRHLSLKTLAILVMIGCIVALFARQMLGEVLPWAGHHWTICRADGILMGVGCAVLSQSPVLTAFIRRTRAWWFACWTTLFAVLLVATKLVPGALWLITIAAAFYSLTVVLIVLRVAPEGITNALRHRILVHFGILCFGLYLLHPVFIRLSFLMCGVDPMVVNLQSAMILTSAYLFTWGAAFLSWRFLELPLIGIGRQLAYQHNSADGVIKDSQA